jgi:hypothetical protein
MKNDGVSFEAGGVSRTLRFSTNAFCDLEDRTGVGINDIVVQLKSKPTMTFIRACFWAGLRGHDATITLEAAGDVVDALGLAQAATLLGEAVSAAFPTAKAKEGDPNPPKPQTGTGTSS